MTGELCLCVYAVMRHQEFRRTPPFRPPERSEAVLEWEAQGERRLLMRQLRTKFGPTLPADLERATADAVS